MPDNAVRLHQPFRHQLPSSSIGDEFYACTNSFNNFEAIGSGVVDGTCKFETLKDGQSVQIHETNTLE